MRFEFRLHVLTQAGIELIRMFDALQDVDVIHAQTFRSQWSSVAPAELRLVEPSGIEPLTSTLPV